MSAFIEHIEIKNFKSIRELKMDGFKKINLFIGKPNVGKSNILEALSLYSVSFSNSYSKFTDLVRAESLMEVFYNGNLHAASVVICKEEQRNFVCSLNYRNRDLDGVLDYSSALLLENSNSSLGHVSSFTGYFDSGFKWHDTGGTNDLDYRNRHIKRYTFKKNIISTDFRTSYLFPPFGSNLLNILEIHPELRGAIAKWFERYGLKLVLDRTSNSVRIQKEISMNEVFSLPYSSVADTLQRIIFYKTAIASNQNSVLIFEEPEAHAYPPYIAEFTQDVINSKTNQFFMATHSPIVVNDFLENAIDDLSIHMVDFKDGQTKVKGLSRDEIEDVYKYGIDLFFNGESYPVL